MKHLRQVNETYFGHVKFSWGTAWSLFKAALVLIVHGVCPWWFDEYGSDVIKAQYRPLQTKKSKISEAVDAFIECTSVDPEWKNERKYEAKQRIKIK